MADYEYRMYVEVAGVVADVTEMPINEMGEAIGRSMNTTLSRVIAGLSHGGGGWEIVSHHVFHVALGSRVVFSFLLRRPR